MKQYGNASWIFPVMPPLPQVMGTPRLRREVMAQIKADPATLGIFQTLAQQEQEAFLEFCMGNRGLKVTFDPFFLHIFDPGKHPERLEGLLSCLLDQEVKVMSILPREGRRISDGSSLVIMDILVQLADKRLVDVEMQRIGYEFPIERGFCYGADLMVRQYDVAKEELGHAFSYREINPIYVIVLMENSPGIFHKHPNQYIHRSSFSFDTGLEMKSLQNFIYIPLDIFRRIPHNNFTELDAWLCFLGSDAPSDILRIVEQYPFFQTLYEDIVRFRYHPKELIVMYSDALKIMDENTVIYMVDEMKAEISRKESEISLKDKELSRKESEISRQQEEIAELRSLLAQYTKDEPDEINPSGNDIAASAQQEKNTQTADHSHT